MERETLRHYVKIIFPLEGKSIKEVGSRNADVNLPEDAVGYQFLDRQEYTASDGEVLVGEFRNPSQIHYKK